MIKRVLFFVIVLSSFVVSVFSETEIHRKEPLPQTTRPNILLIIADDLTYRDLGCYGSVNVKTPHIDSLASEGMKFLHCYNAIAMCVPTRNMLYTGLYPLRTGSYRNHTNSRPGTVSMIPYFTQLGYRVGLAGKVHVGPPQSFPFESVSGLTANCVSATDDYSYEPIKEFITRDRNQPFFLVTAFIQPHVPWTMGNPETFNPEQLDLPPHWADTPQTRQSYAKYLAEVVFLDRQVGELLHLFDESGLRNNTIVLFLSEQGAQFPGAKWTCWEQGLHAGMIIRWPGIVKPESQSSALVQYVDIVPTLLDIAKSIPENESIKKYVTKSKTSYNLDRIDFDGKSFLNVLLGQTSEHGKYAYGIHNNIPEGPRYPIRSVRTKDFSYIRNLLPNEQYIVKFVQKNPKQPYYPSWRVAAEHNDQRAVQAIRRNEFRTEEELYDLKNDPWEMHNLINSPEHHEILNELRKALDDWMKQQGDPGAEIDVPI